MSASAATAPTRRLLVLGGSGYVGQNICDAAVASGQYDAVSSLSRSGRPTQSTPHLPGLSKVEWLRGDIFDEARRNEAFEGVDAVVSAIGAFGSNEFMERVCGDATIEAVWSARERGVSRFGFVSSAQVGGKLRLPPGAPMYGYFRGKARAEDALREAYPDGYVILRPGFIYGPRSVGPLGTIPLQLIGMPISFVGTQLGPVSSLIQSIPFVGTECASMVPVGAVARATIQSLLDKPTSSGRTLSAEDIRKFAY